MSDTERFASLIACLDTHLEDFPHHTPTDVYKWVHQAVRGPGHLIASPGAALERLVEEVEAIEDTTPRDWEEPVELLDADRGMARVHLRPYLRRGGDLRVLAAALVRTATQCDDDPASSLDTLAAALGAARALLDDLGEGVRAFPLQTFDVLMRDVVADRFAPRHHSALYRDSYDPHYRVVLLDALEAAAQDDDLLHTLGS